MEIRTHDAHTRNTTRSTLRLALLTALIPITATGMAGETKEELVRTPDGEALRLVAPKGAQQNLRKGPHGHPFATEKQRREVKPLRWDKRTKAVPETRSEKESLPQGPAESDEGGAPPPFAEYLARQHFPEAWEDIDAMGQNEKEETPDDFSIESDGSHSYVAFKGNYYTSRWKVPPWNKVGKLYFKKPNGSSSYCTANVASGNSVILTAAHCVYTRGQGWNSNFVFVPAYRYVSGQTASSAPYGAYGWTMATVSPNWISNGGRRWDLAAIKLAKNPTSGLPVTSYVGWLGRSWNQPYSQYHVSLGYASNLSTQYTNGCAGYSSYSSAEGADVLVKGCNMTYGSSGGGWLRNFTHNSHGGNHVNAVVSGPHIGSFGSAYVGPRFSSNNLVPVCNAIGC